MNKKGFTLIELLAVIAILGIVITIASVSVVNIIKDSETKSNKIDNDIVLGATETYITENFQDLKKEFKDYNMYFLPVKDLVDKKYINIKNANKLNDNRCILISLINNKIDIQQILNTCPTLLSVSDLTLNVNTISTYIGNKKNIIIPASINGTSIDSIGMIGFNAKELESVIISDGITKIGESAFETNLITNIFIPNSVTEIGDNAFNNNKLTSVVIPNSVTTIKRGAFSNNQLSSVKISDKLTEIDWDVFSNNQLISVVIPAGVTKIGQYAFSNNQLENITIPSTVNKIEEYAFYNNQLESITIPNAVTRIDDNAFADNPNLKKIIFEGRTNLNGLTLGYNWSGTCTNIICGNNPCINE